MGDIKAKNKTDLRKQLVDAVKDKSDVSVSNWMYASISNNNKDKNPLHGKTHLSAICHASARYHEGVDLFFEVLNPKVNYNVEKDKDFLKKFEKWFDYIVHRSPWKMVFKTRSLNTTLKRLMEINLNVPTPVMMGGITALRTGTEMISILDCWLKLVELGATEHQAFVLAHFMSPSLNEDTWILSTKCGGHNVFSSNHDIQDLFTFMEKGYKPDLLEKKGKWVSSRRRIGDFYINKTIAKVKGDYLYDNFDQKPFFDKIAPRDGKGNGRWAKIEGYSIKQIIQALKEAK